jgi:hypothetical protein
MTLRSTAPSTLPQYPPSHSQSPRSHNALFSHTLNSGHSHTQYSPLVSDIRGRDILPAGSEAGRYFRQGGPLLDDEETSWREGEDGARSTRRRGSELGGFATASGNGQVHRQRSRESPQPSHSQSTKPKKRARASTTTTSTVQRGASPSRAFSPNPSSASNLINITGNGHGKSKTAESPMASGPPAVLIREKKQKACSSCRRAKLKCMVEEGNVECVRCRSRKEKCIFYPRGHVSWRLRI